ncbi:MAG: histidine triad nucleotide-binding protein [Planctomycetota bacterium]|jgi:histidine triad (HIT) family protein
MSECIFCRIAEGKMPSDKVHEDDDLVAFRDVNPQAPVHLLVIPRRHIASLNEADEQDQALLGRLLVACRRLAAQEGVGASYRVVNNCGAEAGQSVFHVHLHLLGGRPMGWPPG